MNESIKENSETLKERRQSHDFWFYAVRTLTIISWLLFLFALIMSFYAAPEKSYGIARYHDIEIRRFWLTPITGYLYLVIWFSAAGSYLAILIDKYRSRRKHDNNYFNFHVLLFINIIWLAVILQHVLEVKNII